MTLARPSTILKLPFVPVSCDSSVVGPKGLAKGTSNIEDGNLSFHVLWNKAPLSLYIFYIILKYLDSWGVPTLKTVVVVDSSSWGMVQCTPTPGTCVHVLHHLRQCSSLSYLSHMQPWRDAALAQKRRTTHSSDVASLALYSFVLSSIDGRGCSSPQSRNAPALLCPMVSVLDVDDALKRCCVPAQIQITRKEPSTDLSSCVCVCVSVVGHI